ncbi:MAG: RNA 3'-terminal phosphate cyclase [Pseudomonadota bacterium]
MITIDGTMGEGGGQVFRSSLSLSAITGEPICIQNIRGKRKKTGLLRQHLTALLATAEICGGHVSGAELGSNEISFQPGTIRAGAYRFSVGSAGSANLVLQTILPVLLQATGPSEVTVFGGTHNMASPPYDFLVECFLPALSTMGHNVSAEIKSWGFYPAGGGEIVVHVTPSAELHELTLVERGPEQWRALEAVISNLSGRIAERELHTAGEALKVPPDDRRITTRRSAGPGNVLFARIEFEHLRALFSGFGERGVTAEQVAKRLSGTVGQFVDSRAAVTEHLADQLLLPMALAKGGTFSTTEPSLHTTTNAEIVERFTGRKIKMKPADTRTIFEVI